MRGHNRADYMRMRDSPTYISGYTQIFPLPFVPFVYPPCVFFNRTVFQGDFRMNVAPARAHNRKLPEKLSDPIE